MEEKERTTEYEAVTRIESAQIKTADDVPAEKEQDEASENESVPVADETNPNENASAEQTATENDEQAPNATSEDQPNEQAAVESGKDEEIKEPPKKKKGKKIFWNIFLIAVIALGIWSLFGVTKEIDHDASASVGDVLRSASPAFCVLLIAIVIVAMALDVLKFCIISKTVTGKYRLSASAKTNFLGKYYDAVTPFATGGQPMQIYYLTTKGISGGNASAMVLIRYIFSILCWIVLGAVFMIVGTVKGVLGGVSGGNLLKITGWIGIAVNLIVPTFVLLFLVLPKFMQKLTVGVIKLGHKLRIVKNVDKATERALKYVNDFKNAFKLMATSPVKFILLILTCFCESAITFSVPYFVMRAFSCQVDGLFLAVTSLNVFAIFGVSFIPTPGNSGVMEGMGALAFSVAAGTSLIWSVISWRLLTFYIYIFIGLILTICSIIKKNIKRKVTQPRE